MTAEIAILNVYAVALAADSAVTIDDGENKKVFTSTNKIFNLCKGSPIGIMIYGSVDFMETPWETIIKNFKRLNKKRKYDTLEDCVNEFVKYLKDTEFHTGNLLNECIQNRVLEIFSSLIEDFTIQVEVALARFGRLSDKQIRSAFSDFLIEQLNSAKDVDVSADAENAFAAFKVRFKDYINDTIEFRFMKLYSKKQKSLILNILKYKMLGSNNLTEHMTGLVITGFGENENFPSLYHLRFDLKIEGYLKYDRLSEHVIGDNIVALIKPFAQYDMVARFMEGIDPSYKSYVLDLTEDLLAESASIIRTSLFSGSESKLHKINLEIEKLNDKLLSKFKGKIEEKRREYIDPITNIVRTLPKEEMANMAESLVTVMAVRRKFSNNVETVGGPIDVAVISKGDGFVWINRKHYFKGELNYDFFGERE